MPIGPDWIHEIKYDGYRMMLIRDQEEPLGRPTAFLLSGR